jgi:hypothetical protein
MRLNKMSVKEKMTDSKVRRSSFRNKQISGNRTMRDLGREPSKNLKINCLQMSFVLEKPIGNNQDDADLQLLSGE